MASIGDERMRALRVVFADLDKKQNRDRYYMTRPDQESRIARLIKKESLKLDDGDALIDAKELRKHVTSLVQSNSKPYTRSQAFTVPPRTALTAKQAWKYLSPRKPKPKGSKAKDSTTEKASKSKSGLKLNLTNKVRADSSSPVSDRPERVSKAQAKLKVRQQMEPSISDDAHEAGVNAALNGGIESIHSDSDSDVAYVSASPQSDLDDGSWNGFGVDSKPRKKRGAGTILEGDRDKDETATKRQKQRHSSSSAGRIPFEEDQVHSAQELVDMYNQSKSNRSTDGPSDIEPSKGLASRGSPLQGANDDTPEEESTHADGDGPKTEALDHKPRLTTFATKATVVALPRLEEIAQQMKQFFKPGSSANIDTARELDQPLPRALGTVASAPTTSTDDEAHAVRHGEPPAAVNSIDSKDAKSVAPVYTPVTSGESRSTMKEHDIQQSGAPVTMPISMPLEESKSAPTGLLVSLTAPNSLAVHAGYEPESGALDSVTVEPEPHIENDINGGLLKVLDRTSIAQSQVKKSVSQDQSPTRITPNEQYPQGLRATPDLGERIKQLVNLIISAGYDIVESLSLTSEPVAFVTSPPADLETLYHRMMGRSEFSWKLQAGWLEMEKFKLKSVLVSLVGAAVHEDVFAKPVPWPTSREVLSMPVMAGRMKSLEQLLPGLGATGPLANIQYLMFQAGADMLRDGTDFDEQTVLPIAKQLAEKCFFTVQKHLRSSKSKLTIPDEFCEDTVDSLTQVFRKALLLRGSLEEAPQDYQYFWEPTRSLFNKARMHEIRDWSNRDYRFVFGPVLPGIEKLEEDGSRTVISKLQVYGKVAAR